MGTEALPKPYLRVALCIEEEEKTTLHDKEALLLA